MRAVVRDMRSNSGNPDGCRGVQGIWIFCTASGRSRRIQPAAYPGRGCCGAVAEWFVPSGRTSKNITYCCVDGDTSRGNVTRNVGKSVSIEIELIDSEFSCIAVPACIQRHLFANVCRANQLPMEVGAQGKVIEFIGVVSRLLPHAEAEIAGGGRTVKS